MQKKVKMIITLDSKAESSTEERDKVFEGYGFSRQSLNKKLPLPESSYMGEVDSEEAGRELVKEIWKELKKLSLDPTRICGGIIND